MAQTDTAVDSPDGQFRSAPADSAVSVLIHQPAVYPDRKVAGDYAGDRARIQVRVSVGFHLDSDASVHCGELRWRGHLPESGLDGAVHGFRLCVSVRAQPYISVDCVRLCIAFQTRCFHGPVYSSPYKTDARGHANQELDLDVVPAQRRDPGARLAGVLAGHGVHSADSD